MGPDTTTCMKNFQTSINTYKDRVKSYYVQQKFLTDCQKKIVNFNACTKSYQIYINNCNVKLAKCYAPMPMSPQGEFYIQEEDCGCSGNANIVDYTTDEENNMVFSLVGNPCSGPFNVGFVSVNWQQAYDDALIDILSSKGGDGDTLKICEKYRFGEIPFVRVTVIRKGAPTTVRQLPPNLSVPRCPPPAPPANPFQHGNSLSLYLQAIEQVIDNVTSQVTTCEENLLIAEAVFKAIRTQYCDCATSLKAAIAAAPANSACKKTLFPSDTDIACEKLVNVATPNNPCATK